MTVTDGRRVRGDLSRQAVLAVAVDVASVDGLDGLTIGRLATAVNMSKSGIAGLFRSKQELQLAVVAAAAEIFEQRVVRPTLATPAGAPRLRALVEAFLDYSEGRVFSGGCFFAAVKSEYRSKPGPIRDAIAVEMLRWNGFVTEAVRRAVTAGGLPATTDPEQAAFEITGLLDAANDASLLHDSAEPYVRARAALARLLAA